jgi:glycosyltransferase involved in cell wall biosynthesis
MVAVIGNKIYGQRLVKQLKTHNVDSLLITTSFKDLQFKTKIQSHKIIHYISSPTVNIIGIASLIRFKLWRKKIIISWIGSDVLKATKNPLFKILSKMCQILVDQNLVVAPHLQKELKEININSKTTPLPVFNLFEFENLPNENNILVYLPDDSKSKFEFFQGNIIKKTVQDFPEINFIIVANSGKEFSQKNVKCIQWSENMKNLYMCSKGVIRLPLHDGLSNTILEAISMGRFVMASNTSIPHCVQVNSYESLKNSLYDILKQPKSHLKTGSDTIRKMYNLEKITKKLVSEYRLVENKN